MGVSSVGALGPVVVVGAVASVVAEGPGGG